MAYPSIIYTDLSQYTFSSSVQSNIYLGTDNLNNYNTHDVWQSNTASSYQSLYITFPTNKTVTDFIIHNHNWDNVVTTGSIKLEYSDNQAFTSNVATACTITAIDNVLTHNSFDSVSKRFWRVIFSGSLNDTPYAGNIFMDSKLQFPYTQQWNYKHLNYEFNTSEKVNLAGKIINSQTSKGRLISEYNFTQLSESFKSDFITFINTIKGKLFPFYFVGHDDTIIYSKLDSDYSPIDVIRWEFNDVQNFKIKSVDVGNSVTQVFPEIYIYDHELITSFS